MGISEELVSAFNTYLEENAKFTDKKVKAAAPRARKALRDDIRLAHERRLEIQKEKEVL